MLWPDEGLGGGQALCSPLREASGASLLPLLPMQIKILSLSKGSLTGATGSGFGENGPLE